MNISYGGYAIRQEGDIDGEVDLGGLGINIKPADDEGIRVTFDRKDGGESEYELANRKGKILVMRTVYNSRDRKRVARPGLLAGTRAVEGLIKESKRRYSEVIGDEEVIKSE